MSFYKKYKLLVFFTIVLSWTFAGLNILVPILEGNMLANFTEGESFNIRYILELALILVGVRIGIEIITHLWSMTVLKLNTKVDFDIKHSLLNSLMKLKSKNFDRTGSGVFVSRINKDSHDLAEVFDDITDDFSEILLNISFIIYTYFINIYIGIFLSLTVLTIYAIDTIRLKRFKENSLEYRKKDEKVIGSYSDLVKGMKDVKNLGLHKVLIPKINVEQLDSLNANKKTIHEKRSFNRVMDSILHMFNFLFIILSIYLISINSLTITGFLIVFVYKDNIISMIKALANIREKIANASVAARRVFDIIDFKTFEKEEYGKNNLENVKGKIEFKKVQFSYTKNTKLFQNLNFTINPNSMVAFVGKSGEGKSTILDLISKNYDINFGSIKIENIDIKEISENSIRDNISIVSQEPYIFNLSIKDNIRIANPDATDEEIVEVCKKAYIHEFVENKENGYDTIVGENGVTLSGGQKQRLAIARALIKKSKIILLDEATSSLDNHSQNRIKEIIKELSKNHTIVIVAHRLSTILDADEIFVVQDHQIREKGTHKYLMENSKYYSDLYINEVIDSEEQLI